MDKDIITKSFSLTAKDHVDFAISTYLRNIFLSPYVLIFIGVVFGLPAIVCLHDIIHGRYIAFAILAAIAALLFLIGPVISTVKIASTFKKSPIHSTARTAHMTEAYLDLTGPGFNVRLTWPSFVRVRKTQRMICLYISGGMAHLIPISAFVSLAESVEFYDRAKRYVVNMRNQSTVPNEDKTQSGEDLGKWATQPHKYTFGTYATWYLPASYAAFFNPYMLIFPAFLIGFSIWISRFDIIAGRWLSALKTAAYTLTPYVLIILITPVIMMLVAWLGTARLPISKGLRTFALTPENLVCHGATFHSEIRWTKILKIRKKFGQIHFLTQPNLPTIVPFSAFKDKDEAKAFFDQAMIFWKDAKA